MDVTQIEHLRQFQSVSACWSSATPDTLAAAGTTTINPTQIALLAGGVLLLLIVVARHARSRTKPGESITKSDRRRGQAIDEHALREVEAVMGQLDQLSRQIHARIDLKLATLQKVIHDADQRIDQFSRLQRGAEGQPTLDIELESEIPGRQNEDAQSPHDAVYRLADSGYTPLQIAKELSRHTGEVELILSLRRAKHSPKFDALSGRKQAG
jgi:hypothetical protein